MIPLSEQENIRERFREELKGPVKIDFFTRRPSAVFVPGREECPLCPQTGEMLSEIAHLATRIDLRVHDFGAGPALEERYGVERVPATVVRGVVNRPVLFTGIPTGNLFPVLMETIVAVSGDAPELPAAARRRLKRLKQRVRVQVFALPTAPYCAEQALVAIAVGLSSPHVRVEVIEVAEFPRLVEAHAIQSVPATVIEGTTTLTGLTEPDKLVEAIVHAAEHRAVAAPGRLFTATAAGTSTPLPALAPPSAPREEPGTVRPSGLFIPGR